MIEPLDWTKCIDGAEDKLTQVRNVVCKLFDRVNMLVDEMNKLTKMAEGVKFYQEGIPEMLETQKPSEGKHVHKITLEGEIFVKDIE